MKNAIEIMSPVGSYESLMAAIQGGARSVYFGIEQLNMRARSSANFTINDLHKISDICRKHGINSNIALNTVIYDQDLTVVKDIIDVAKETGIKAVIATDQSVINYAFEKNIKIHLSTQLNISNLEAVKFYSRFADVIVLARELNLDQITKITQSIKDENITGPSGKLIRIEVFVHGALCMAISGKCFMSLHLHGASANRGACYQVCRREFSVKDDRGIVLCLDNQYIMSPKDLCTLPILNRIISAGASILKIEGRGRSPEYVKTTTEVYKSAVDSISDGSFSEEKIKAWMEKLKSVYNRGFWEGHYLGEITTNWNTNIYGSKATQIKTYLAKGIKYFRKIQVAEFLMEAGELKKGQQILIIGPTTGVIKTIIKELRINDKPVPVVRKGDCFSIPLENTIRSSDKLYLVKKTTGINFQE